MCRSAIVANKCLNSVAIILFYVSPCHAQINTAQLTIGCNSYREQETNWKSKPGVHVKDIYQYWILVEAPPTSNFKQVTQIKKNISILTCILIKTKWPDTTLTLELSRLEDNKDEPVLSMTWHRRTSLSALNITWIDLTITLDSTNIFSSTCTKQTKGMIISGSGIPWSIQVAYRRSIIR